jgi:hypothetical protein
MSRSRFKLTPEIEEKILSFIRAGGFADVAAEAAGIPREVFERWCRHGEQPHSTARYRDFALAVRVAVAQARLHAEVEVRKEKPLDWLRNGPGRERAEQPGWTANARARTTATGEASVFDDAEAIALIEMLLEVLEGSPEKRELFAGLIARAKEAARNDKQARKARDDKS